MQKYRLIFMGTPLIAKEALKVLNDEYDIVLVVIQPDRKKDRKGNFIYSEVKQFCLKQNLPFVQPEKVVEIQSTIAQLNPDLIVTCAFGQFVPNSILNIPKYKCVNFHASLLPKLRGGAPIQWAIIRGYTETGWTLMYMDKQMDHGNILAQFRFKINPDLITYSELYEQFIKTLAPFIHQYLPTVFNSNIQSLKQNEQDVTIGLNIKKSDRYIDWNQNKLAILHLVNGLSDTPLALCTFNNLDLKIQKVQIVKSSIDISNYKNGEIVIANEKELLVKCQDGLISILQLQWPNKKMLSYSELQKGNKQLQPGLVFQEKAVNS